MRIFFDSDSEDSAKKILRDNASLQRLVQELGNENFDESCGIEAFEDGSIRFKCTNGKVGLTINPTKFDDQRIDPSIESLRNTIQS